MNVLGTALVLAGGGIFFAGVWAMFRPVRSMGLTRPRQGAIATLVAFAVVFLGWQMIASHRGEAEARALAAAAEAAARKPPSRDELLQDVTISNFRWERAGRAGHMKASFLIQNHSRVPVKDIKIACMHSTSAGRKVEGNTGVVRASVDSRGHRAIADFNMGFVDRAIKATNCQIVDVSQM